MFKLIKIARIKNMVIFMINVITKLFFNSSKEFKMIPMIFLAY